MANFLTELPNSLNDTPEVGPTTDSRKSRDYGSTICSSGTRKTESKINYCSGRKEKQFKQSQISSE